MNCSVAELNANRKCLLQYTQRFLGFLLSSQNYKGSLRFPGNWVYFFLAILIVVSISSANAYDSDQTIKLNVLTSDPGKDATITNSSNPSLDSGRSIDKREIGPGLPPVKKIKKGRVLITIGRTSIHEKPC